MIVCVLLEVRFRDSCVSLHLEGRTLACGKNKIRANR
jgi:hypothetical protein